MTVNVIAVEGRIGHVERYQDKVYTEVLIPEEDAYAAPGCVKIESDHELGAVGQVITVDCKPRGYVRTFRLTQGTRAGQNGREVRTWFVPVSH